MATPKSFYGRVLNAPLVDLSSVEGRARLSRAFADGTAETFVSMISQLQTQAFPAACGLTTLAVILNSLRIDPERVWLKPWRWYTEDLLTCCSSSEKIKVEGVTLDEFACIARCNGLDVLVLRGLDANAVRTIVTKSVSQLRAAPDSLPKGDETSAPEAPTKIASDLVGRVPVQCVAVSYSRKAVNQTGTGHFSPIAAFDKESDSVLILDTARFKYPPAWVPVAQLAEAASTVDPESGLQRGFAVLMPHGGKKVCRGPLPTSGKIQCHLAFDVTGILQHIQDLADAAQTAGEFAASVTSTDNSSLQQLLSSWYNMRIPPEVEDQLRQTMLYKAYTRNLTSLPHTDPNQTEITSDTAVFLLLGLLHAAAGTHGDNPGQDNEPGEGDRKSIMRECLKDATDGALGIEVEDASRALRAAMQQERK